MAGYTHPYACAGSGVDQILPYSKRVDVCDRESKATREHVEGIKKVRQHEIKYLESGPLHKRVDPRAEVLHAYFCSSASAAHQILLAICLSDPAGGLQKEREYLKAAADAANARHALRDQLSVVWLPAHCYVCPDRQVCRRTLGSRHLTLTTT